MSKAITEKIDQNSAALVDARNRHPSLRKRLLRLLLLPMLVIVLATSVMFYLAALAYSKSVHDRDLGEQVKAMAAMLKHDRSDGTVSMQARALIEYSPLGLDFFSIKSARRGLMSASKQTIPPPPFSQLSDSPRFYDTRIGQTAARAAVIAMPSPRDARDTLIVTMAETLHDRERRANEILLMMIPLELLLSGLLLVLLWHGTRVGLRVFDPLIERLDRRKSGLEPVTAADVPIEILPLTHAIDGLFSRSQALIESQEQFITDAAHQLRTPLTGLMLHSENAANSTDADDREMSLRYIHQLSTRVARTSSQLLAMARAQAADPDPASLRAMDLDALLREMLFGRVREALAAGVDLGYAGPETSVKILADDSALKDVFDNLLDNALKHVNRGGKITVTLTAERMACVSFDDDGNGVPAQYLSRLGERFFRAPGASAEGTGLGLAIVQKIVARHGGSVGYADSPLGGLRAEIRLPRA